MPDKALWKLNPEYQHSIPERFEELRGLYASRCLEAVGLIPDVIVECQGKLHIKLLLLECF